MVQVGQNKMIYLQVEVKTIGGGVSPAVAAIMAGGEPPAPGIGASTEEWTVDATLSDVTVS